MDNAGAEGNTIQGRALQKAFVEDMQNNAEQALLYAKNCKRAPLPNGVNSGKQHNTEEPLLYTIKYPLRGAETFIEFSAGADERVKQ